MSEESSAQSGAARGGWREFVRGNLVAVTFAVLSTVAVQLGVLLSARRSLGEPGATALTLGASLLWLMIAAPILSATGRTAFEGVCRGGAVADASLVVVIVLAAGEGLSAAGAVKIYLVWAGVALAGSATARMAGSARMRRVAASAAVLAGVILAAAPFWANGAILATRSPSRERLASLSAGVSGAYVTFMCMDDVDVVWTEKPILYGHTVLGRDVQFAPPAWWATAAGYGAASAAILCGPAFIRRRGDRRGTHPPARASEATESPPSPSS